MSVTEKLVQNVDGEKNISFTKEDLQKVVLTGGGKASWLLESSLKVAFLMYNASYNNSYIGNFYASNTRVNICNLGCECLLWYTLK